MNTKDEQARIDAAGSAREVVQNMIDHGKAEIAEAVDRWGEGSDPVARARRSHDNFVHGRAWWEGDGAERTAAENRRMGMPE